MIKPSGLGARAGRIEDLVDARLPRELPQVGVTLVNDFALFVRRGWRDDDAVVRANGAGVQRDALLAVEGGKAVGMDGDAAAAIGLVGGDQIGQVEPRAPRQLKALPDPVFDFLKGRGFENRHVEMLGQEARVGRYLGPLGPSVVAHGD